MQAYLGELLRTQQLCAGFVWHLILFNKHYTCVVCCGRFMWASGITGIPCEKINALENRTKKQDTLPILNLPTGHVV